MHKISPAAATRPLRHIGLPSFGHLCSKACSWLGIDPSLASSLTQRDWIESAHRAISLLDPLGSHVPQFRLLARDGRPWPRRIDRAWEAMARRLGSLDARHGGPHGLASLTSALSRSGDGSFEHVAQISPDAKADPLFSSLALCLGSESLARSFVVAHEWAHAWQAERHYPVGKSAAIAANSLLSVAALDLLRSFSGRHAPSATQPQGLSHKAAAMALKTVEEAFCDSAGCWVAERLGCHGAASKIAAFRKATAHIAHASESYHNHDIILAMMPPGAPLPPDFASFAAQASLLGSLQARRLFLAPPADSARLDAPSP
jgi:hypothetical protein